MPGYPSTSLRFGNQNFFFVNQYVGSSISGDANIYVFLQEIKGMVLICRYAPDDSEGRYLTMVGDYDTIVAGRGGYVYVLPSQLVELQTPR